MAAVRFAKTAARVAAETRARSSIADASSSDASAPRFAALATRGRVVIVEDGGETREVRRRLHRLRNARRRAHHLVPRVVRRAGHLREARRERSRDVVRARGDVHRDRDAGNVAEPNREGRRRRHVGDVAGDGGDGVHRPSPHARERVEPPGRARQFDRRLRRVRADGVDVFLEDVGDDVASGDERGAATEADAANADAVSASNAARPALARAANASTSAVTFVWIRIGASVKTSVLFRAYETSYAARSRSARVALERASSDETRNVAAASETWSAASARVSPGLETRARVASRSDARGHVRSRQGTSRGRGRVCATRTREETRASAATHLAATRRAAAMAMSFRAAAADARRDSSSAARRTSATHPSLWRWAQAT